MFGKDKVLDDARELNFPWRPQHTMLPGMATQARSTGSVTAQSVLMVCLIARRAVYRAGRAALQSDQDLAK